MPKKTALKHRLSPTYKASSEDRAWLDMAPVGREFGSPDYERLTALDQATFVVFQSWEQVRKWLAAPNAQLDGELVQRTRREAPMDLAKSCQY
ncbi:MAG: hypothetical protein U1D69_00130 [Polynucleobacter sp.]|jgi:hypothetical protein|nr:hypothetical protein [Polynucleobacter sp.]